MRCKNCGEKIRKKDAFCSSCGTAVQGKESSGKGKLIVGILVIVALTVGIVVGAILISNQSPQKKYMKQMALAESYYSEKEYERAVASYQAAIRIDPKNADAYLGLAQVYDKMGDAEKALEVLEDGYDQTEEKSLTKKIEKMEQKVASEEASGKTSKGETKEESKDAPKEVKEESKESKEEDKPTEDKDLGPKALIAKKTTYYVIGTTYEKCVGWITYEYDSNGNKKKEIEYDEYGNVTCRSEYEYDEKGNLTLWFYYLSDSGDMYMYQPEYDEQGRMTRNTHFAYDRISGSYEVECVELREYDELGRMTKHSYLMEKYGDFHYYYQYDGSHYKCTCVEPKSTHTEEGEMDKKGNKKSVVVYDQDGNFKEQTDYDKWGNPSYYSMYSGDEHVECYYTNEYDEYGNPTKLIESSTYNGYTYEYEYIMIP